MSLIVSTFYSILFYAAVAASILWKLAPLAQLRANPWDGVELNWLEKIIYGGLSDFAKIWNGYEVHGLETVIKNKNNCLLIGYHSRPTLDLFYLTATIQCHVLVTHLLFYIPVIGNILPLLGVSPSTGGIHGKAEKNVVSILTHGSRPLMLLPGGAVECLKAYHNRYRVLWKEVPGFARVIREYSALGSNTRVIPFYTKNSERVMWTTAWWYTLSGRIVKYLLNLFREGNYLVLPFLMVMLLFSLGFFLLPSNVKLDTYFGEPLTIRPEESAKEFADRVKHELHDLIDRVNAIPKKPRKISWQQRIQFILYGLFTIVQNIVTHSIGIVFLLCILYPLIYASKLLTPRRSLKPSTSFDGLNLKLDEHAEGVAASSSSSSSSTGIYSTSEPSATATAASTTKAVQDIVLDQKKLN